MQKPFCPFQPLAEFGNSLPGGFYAIPRVVSEETSHFGSEVLRPIRLDKEPIGDAASELREPRSPKAIVREK
jgi:hypothetical protein